jgi:hypothetical protein
MRESWRRRAASAALVLVVLSVPAAAHAGVMQDAGGHLSFGYSKLFAEDSPGGSLSVAAGIDFPIQSTWRAGADLGFHLLGSRTVEEGSLSAGLDYSLLEVVGLLHWVPAGNGALGRVSVGGGLMSARADLAAAAGGAAFSDLAVEEIAPGAAFEVAVLRPSTSPVRIGLLASTRIAFLPDETWTVASARLVFFY